MIEKLRKDFLDAQYFIPRIENLVGPVAFEALEKGHQYLASQTLREKSTPLAIITLLFLLGESVSSYDLEQAFRHTGILGLQQLGLIDANYKKSKQNFQSTVDFRPYELPAVFEFVDAYISEDDKEIAHVWVVSDLGETQRPGALDKDHVLGIGQASLTLEKFVGKEHKTTALDLGSGCGIQSLHLLTHVDHVTATDISERALNFTYFNCLFNAPQLGIDPARPENRITVRYSNLFSEFGDEKFELIVSNPPFVIKPQNDQKAYTYRETDFPGDELMFHVLQGIDRHLCPGGTAQLLGNWEVRTHQQWSARLESWFDKFSDLDVWVISEN